MSANLIVKGTMIPTERCISAPESLLQGSLNIKLITSWQVLNARSFRAAGSDINHCDKSKGMIILEQAIKV